MWRWRRTGKRKLISMDTGSLSEQTLDVHYENCGFQSSEKAVMYKNGLWITSDKCSLEVLGQVLSPQMMLQKHRPPPWKDWGPGDLHLEVMVETQPLPPHLFHPYHYDMSCLAMCSSHDGFKVNGEAHLGLKKANTWVETKVLWERHVQRVKSLMKDTSTPDPQWKH